VAAQSPGAVRSVPSRRPGTGRFRAFGLASQAFELLHDAYGLWHDAGRSLAGPVHWPLWPAPLPPLVGGLGVPNAGPVVVRMPAVTSAMAAVRNRRFLIESPPFLPPLHFLRISVGQTLSRLASTCSGISQNSTASLPPVLGVWLYRCSGLFICRAFNAASTMCARANSWAICAATSGKRSVLMTVGCAGQVILTTGACCPVRPAQPSADRG
jgi:hypothetical protein